MPFLKAGRVSEFPSGSVTEVSIGEFVCAVSNAGGTIHAVAGVCPHRGAPLGQGAVHGHTLVCPWHAWEWDCRTGQSLHYPDLKLARYEVKVEDGDVLIEVP